MLTDATLPLFIVGIALLLISIVCELWELQIANLTLFEEISELDNTSQP
jgi:hypothetical protein